MNYIVNIIKAFFFFPDGNARTFPLLFFFFPQTYYSKYDFMKAVHLQQSCTQIEKGTVDFLK